MAEQFNETQFINLHGQPVQPSAPAPDAATILARVYQALQEKGYNPVTQIVGYLTSGDPTYITNHNRARFLIMKVERDELMTELVEHYINTKLNN